MILQEDRTRIDAYLAEKHPRGVTVGEVRFYLPYMSRVASGEIRACFEGLVREDLAEIVLIPAGKNGHGYKIAMRTYVATVKLLARMKAVEKEARTHA